MLGVKFKRTRLLILDQDGTLYPRIVGKHPHPLCSQLQQLTKRWLLARGIVSELYVESFYKDLARKFPNPYEGFFSLRLPLRTSCLSLEGAGYLDLFELIDLTHVSPDLELHRMLTHYKSNLGIGICVVTLASKSYSKRLQKALGLHDLIDRTINPLDIDSFDITKKSSYSLLMDDYNVLPEETLVAGDSFWNDLAPAIELGIDAALISSGELVEEIEGIAEFSCLSRLLDSLDN